MLGFDERYVIFVINKGFMKNWLLLLMLTSFGLVQAQHRLEFNVKHLKNDTVYLANFMAGKQYIVDTALATKPGQYIFEGNKNKPGGIYLLVNQKKQILFQFVIDEQNITFNTDTLDYTNNLTVKGSQENEWFFEYWGVVGKLQADAAPFRAQLQDCKDSKSEECLKAREEFDRINEEVMAFQKKFYAEHPDAFVTKVLKMAEEPTIPETITDQTEKWRYYKKHYWDNTDFTDERMVRTPVLHSRLMRYLEKIIIPTSDSIIAEIEPIIAQSEGHYEMYRYLVSQLTYKYESSKQMCVDKVFVYLVDNHYKTQKAKWVDEVQRGKIISAANDKRPCLCGNTAKNLVLKDPNGKFQELHALTAPYKVIFFWDSGCGHCKKTTPKLKLFYDAYKSKGVEIYGVNTEDESKDYLKYIKENDLKWINTQDTTHQSLFRSYYNIFSTPVIYLLDKDNKIIAKNIDVKNLAILIDRQLGEFDENKNYDIYATPKKEEHETHSSGDQVDK